MRRTEVYLKPAIIDYCKTVLVAEDIENLSLSNKVYYIFDELCHISQSIVDDLLPFIEHRLTVNIKSLDKITYIRVFLEMTNEKHRRDATKIVAYVTSSSNNDFALRHKSLWTTFLQRYTIGYVLCKL
ncbi:unnamed protein product [Didymodactylos carnosus]|uniref:Uncharacterized protein n=1 Tax=Didymodactylos carnosus TaxID=1234261 RepID=A0A8S2WJZ4_9BILA|nr:unnamed protein product [Didymodactylos carnosus]